LSIFTFFSTLWCICFWHKYILTSHHIRLKSVVYFEFYLFVFWPTIICKNIVKILRNNDMVEVQTWDTLKQYNVTTILGAPIMSFHPNVFKCICGYFLMNIKAIFCSIHVKGWVWSLNIRVFKIVMLREQILLTFNKNYHLLTLLKLLNGW